MGALLMRPLPVLLLLLLCIGAGARDKHTVRGICVPRVLVAMTGVVQRQFEDGEVVPLWYNKVGPYNNPQETYQYFDLPFCRPEGAHTDCAQAASNLIV